MAPVNLFTDMSTAEWILNFAIHSLVVLSAGWLLLSLFKRKSAPLRSKISFVTMLALLLLPLFSILYHSFDITFYKTYLPFNSDSRLSLSDLRTDEISAVGEHHDSPGMQLDQSRASAKRKSKINTFFNSVLSRITTVNLINGVGVVWLIGFLLFLGRLLYGAGTLVRFKKGFTRIKDSHLDSILIQAQKTFAFRSLPEICTSESVKIPMTLGILRPLVVLPQRFYDELSSIEIKAILFHELSHIYHKDQATGVLQRIVTALYWWNPMVHALSTDFSKTREEISDNHAIMGNSSREYAECLVNLAERATSVRQLPFSQGLAIRHIPLRDRITQILSKERIMATETKKSTTLIILLVFLLSIGLIAGHKWTFASDETEPQVELAQETEIQEETVTEQEKEQEQEKETEKGKKKEKAQEETLSAQEKEEIEKMLKELKIKLSAIKLDLYPVKFDVKVVKDGGKMVLVKDICLSARLSEEMRGMLDELKLTMSDVRADMESEIHVDIDPVIAQEKTLSEEEKEKIRKKVKDIQLKLAEKLELKDMKLKLSKQMDVDVAREIGIVLKRYLEVDADIKVEVKVKPVLVVKVEPEFPEEAKEKGIYGEVVVEGTTDKKGNVIKVKILKGAHELLNKAVVDAVKQWKYELPEHKGKSYAITFTVTVRFNPKDKDGNPWTVSIDS
jgi:TonB family protein